jgi:hypothetical protein
VEGGSEKRFNCDSALISTIEPSTGVLVPRRDLTGPITARAMCRRLERVPNEAPLGPIVEIRPRSSWMIQYRILDCDMIVTSRIPPAWWHHGFLYFRRGASDGR